MQDNKKVESEKRRLSYRKIRDYKAALAEIMLWILIAILPIINSLVPLMQENFRWQYIAVNMLPSLFFSLLILLLPTMFRQIFGTYPLMAARQSRIRRRIQGIKSGIPTEMILGSEITINSMGIHTTKESQNPRSLMQAYAKDSAQVAERIYGRAGSYLLGGAFIAFTGLGIFYIRTDALPATDSIMDRIFQLLPGFGVLFFIEFVAIFFLRQYRSAMDDFRYYDAVRRHREESLVALHMFSENSSIALPKEVLSAVSLYSSAGKIGKDETLDIIESKKLYRDEIQVFEKIIDAVSAISRKKD